MLKYVLYSIGVLVDLLQTSLFSSRHTPGWLRASAGHVASSLCSVHANWVSVLNMWLKAFVATAYRILNCWPKCALKQQALDGGRLVCMEWRLGPLFLFSFSMLFLLPVFKKKSKLGKCPPLRAVANYLLLQFVTFKILPLFHKGARANKQNESMKKSNHNLKAWRRAWEIGARRNSQVWQIFAFLWSSWAVRRWAGAMVLACKSCPQGTNN